MSAIIDRFIFCDGECGENFGLDSRGLRTINEQRQEAREQGWKRKNGKDYCPECAPKFIRVANVKSPKI